MSTVQPNSLFRKATSVVETATVVVETGQSTGSQYSLVQGTLIYHLADTDGLQ